MHWSLMNFASSDVEDPDSLSMLSLRSLRRDKNVKSAAKYTSRLVLSIPACQAAPFNYARE